MNHFPEIELQPRWQAERMEALYSKNDKDLSGD